MQRQYSFFDKIFLQIDEALRTLTNDPHTLGRAYPAEQITDSALTDAEQKHAAALMRINHAGEICAQALYHGQALTSHSATLTQQMQQAAVEEGDHLAWCKKRLDELHSHTSYLNPLWYSGSFCIGLAAGMIGDKWSLGFVAETEAQVFKHLDSHLHLLPTQDARSYKILQQMQQDEAKHREQALAEGAHLLPEPVKKMMTLTAKIMVKIAYWV